VTGGTEGLGAWDAKSNISGVSVTALGARMGIDASADFSCALSLCKRRMKTTHMDHAFTVVLSAINPTKTLPYVFKEFSQHGSIALPKGHRRSIVQLYEHVAFRRQIELINVIEIDNRISMDAEKTVRVKHCLQSLHALAEQMRRFAHMDPNILAR
jgi:hypothetical protein